MNGLICEIKYINYVDDNNVLTFDSFLNFLIDYLSQFS